MGVFLCADAGLSKMNSPTMAPSYSKRGKNGGLFTPLFGFYYRSNLGVCTRV